MVILNLLSDDDREKILELEVEGFQSSSRRVGRHPDGIQEAVSLQVFIAPISAAVQGETSFERRSTTTLCVAFALVMP